MAIKTSTIYICDRCNHETNNSDDRRGQVEGSCKLVWSGHEGGCTMQGDWGGVTFKGDAWLCFDCQRDFRSFMEGSKKDKYK